MRDITTARSTRATVTAIDTNGPALQPLLLTDTHITVDNNDVDEDRSEWSNKDALVVSKQWDWDMMRTLIAHAPRNATTTATQLTVSWNCRNFAMLSYTLRPHMTAFTMLVKLSSVKMMSDASFATSVPAIPYTCTVHTENTTSTVIETCIRYTFRLV